MRNLFLHFFIFTLFLSPNFSAASASANTLLESVSYQKVLQTFKGVYGPLLREKAGLELEVQIDQENPDYFGGASIEGHRFIVSLGNSLPAQPGMTAGAIAFALCHEAGHALGGAPKKTSRENKLSWASVEGQSDYYAASTCLPKLFSTKELQTANQSQAIVQSGLDWMLTVYELIRFSGIAAPSINTPDLSVAPTTVVTYPTLQCRLDTIVAGAGGQPRPPCWFRPH
jgi:hypothetical protein